MQIELNSPLLGGDARRAEGAKTKKQGLKPRNKENKKIN